METFDLDPHCVYPPQFRTQYWVVPYLMAPKFSSVTVVLNSGWKEEQGREWSEKCPQLILIHTSLCLHMPFETSPRQSHTNIITETMPSWEICCTVQFSFLFLSTWLWGRKGNRTQLFLLSSMWETEKKRIDQCNFMHSVVTELTWGLTP